VEVEGEKEMRWGRELRGGWGWCGYLKEMIKG
jgi:hypothetical protein